MNVKPGCTGQKNQPKKPATNMARLEKFMNVKHWVTDRFVKESTIKSIANLKVAKDWKWAASDRLFRRWSDHINHQIVLEYLNITEPREHKFDEQLKSKVEKALETYVYHHFDFGRKKNKDHGYNCPLQIKSGNLYHENTFQYKGKFRGKVGSDLCPDFSVLFHRTKPMFMYRLPWMEKAETLELTQIACFGGQLWENETMAEVNYRLYGLELIPTENNNLYRVSSFSFKGLPITWNEEERAFEHPEYGIYHIGRLWQHEQDVNNFKAGIVRSFKQRRNYKRKNEQIIDKASRVFVTEQDSLEAGNCEIETRKFANWIKKRYNFKGEGVNLRGDELLSLRNDDFTRRAVQRAMERQGVEKTSSFSLNFPRNQSTNLF